MRSTTLPNNWCEATFEDVLADISNGISDSQNKEAEGIPVSRIETIATGKVNLAKIGYVSNISESAAERYLLNPGDILFSHINSPAHIGKTAIFRSGRLYHGTNVLRIRTQRDTCTPEYFEYYCRYFRSIGEFSMNAQHAVNQSSLNQKKIKAFTLPLPPLAEQTRIAQKLDELLAQVDTLKARIDGIPALLKRFRQSILAAAVSGRLTEEWRLNASAWSDTTIGQVCSVATGKTPKRDIPGYWENGDIPWLTSALTGSNFCSEAEQFVTAFAVKDCALKVFQPGTLLMAMYGEGKTRGQVTELKIAATCNQACAALVVDESLARKAFVKIRLQENYEEIRKQAVGGAQPNLNLNKVREITIRLPSLPEQTEIVRRVEQLFAFADQLEAKVASAKSRIDHLTQSILAKAFRGELVPQDPNDEPASVLLERINAQRAAAPKAKRGRKASV